MKKIADYDTLSYDYATYWENREYEHKAEKLVLNKILSNCSGVWFLDIGGSFGRLLPAYYDSYSHPVIVDYSLLTLQKNYSKLKKKYPNVELIAANAYFLPFKDSSFDGCLMVRVLHHINRPKEIFNEIHRILHKDSVYLQEYANKLHIKAILKSLITFNFSIFNKEPYQQPDKNNNEGARRNVSVPFFNYHTKWITDKIHNSGFAIKKKYGCSFLRLNFLKNTFKTKTLLKLESILQNTISPLNLSPSIFLKSGTKKSSLVLESTSLENILACPKCKGTLNISKSGAKCPKCNLEFKKKENIWDFRI